MALDNLIPDKELNKGGRPSTTDKKDTDRDSNLDGNPYTKDKDSGEYWENVANVVGLDITAIADYTHTNVWHVREKLEEFNIMKTDWDDIPDDYPAKLRGESLTAEPERSSNKNEIPEDGALSGLM